MKKFLYIIIGIVALAACKSDNDNTTTPVTPEQKQEVINLNIDVILPNSVRKALQPAIDDAMSAISDAQQKSAKRVKLNLR